MPPGSGELDGCEVRTLHKSTPSKWHVLVRLNRKIKRFLQCAEVPATSSRSSLQLSESTGATLAVEGTPSNSSSQHIKKTAKNVFLDILTGLSEVSGAIPVAGAPIKAVAGSLHTIIQKLDVTDENRQNFQDLSDRIARLSRVIEKRKTRRRQDEAKSCGQALENKLTELESLVEAAQAQGMLEQFFNGSADSSSLRKYISSLDSLRSDLTLENTEEMLARSGHDEQQVKTEPYQFLRRVWVELVNPDQKPAFQYWEEVTSNIEGGKWMGGTYTAPSKFDGVTYDIRVAFSTIKWTITVPQYSTWYPGTYSGYLYSRPDLLLLSPPKLCFTTPIFSPLLGGDGRMSCDLLWGEANAWGPKHKLKDILDVVAFMLTVDPAFPKDWCREHLPDIPLHFNIRANILVYDYFNHNEEAFRRAALFFARVFGTPKEIVVDSPISQDDYQLKSSRLVVNELLAHLRRRGHWGKGGKPILDAPFKGIVSGISLLSDLVKEERRCADILAKEYHILFDPPDKQKLEEMIAKYSSEREIAG